MRRGQPGLPLRIWQWVVAVSLPISTLLGSAQIAWIDQRQAQQMVKQELPTHITLLQSVVRGDIALYAGSHIRRDMH
ncbi:hypothetical protein CTR2_R08630 [Comamonas thiooxydans]|uniref:hypothetical protein n=1 Tax=Comamonas thiooxydans TaxID=363952 RepID=UPI000A2E9D57|nr:hypothetical protein [Comamonas thiooxydans]BDR07525.1 hypothetical protein CTR2_R08630 [Comamonas thiooxydans]